MRPVIPTPHDRLFRAVFARADCAADLLRSCLPARLVAHLDLESLTLEPDSFVDDDLRSAESDLLYRTALAGADAYVYVLLEHQSTDDSLMALRLLRYALAIWHRWLADHPGARAIPPIVPVVVYHGATRWRSATRLSELYALPRRSARRRRPTCPSWRLPSTTSATPTTVGSAIGR